MPPGTNIQPEAFPEFSELCRQARDMEKSLLEVKPRKMSDTLDLSDSSAIFPKEFEDYTFAYALSEAQKVERKLFTSSYQAALDAPSQEGEAQPQKPSEMDEGQIESELHKFASADKPSLPQQKIAEPERPGTMSIGPLKFPSLHFGKKQAQPASKQEEEAPLRKPTGLPAEIQLASEAEASARERLLKAKENAQPQPKAQARPSLQLPFMPKRTPVPKELPVAPQPPPEPPEEDGPEKIKDMENELEFGGEAPAQTPQKGGKRPSRLEAGGEQGEEPGQGHDASPEIEKAEGRHEPGAGPEIEKGEERGFGEEIPPRGGGAPRIPEKELAIPKAREEAGGEVPLPDEKPPASGKIPLLPSQSKLAPRLREIIEARLKKEEEAAKQMEEEEKEEEPPPAAETEGQLPEEKPQEEEIIMSARERMLRRGTLPGRKGAEKAKIGRDAPSEAEPEIEREEAEPGHGLEAGPEIEKEEEGEHDIGAGGEQDEGQEQGHSEPEKEEGEGRSLGREKAAAKGGGKKQEEEGAGFELPADPGGMTIRPIFAGDEHGGGGQPPTKRAAQKETPIEEARLRRIQKIIGELAADKYRAGAIPKKEEEKEEGEEMPPKKKGRMKTELAHEEVREEAEPGEPPARLEPGAKAREEEGPAKPDEPSEPPAKPKIKARAGAGEKGGGLAMKAASATAQKSKAAPSSKKMKGGTEGPKKKKGRAKEGEGEYGEEKPAAKTPVQKKQQGQQPFPRRSQQGAAQQKPAPKAAQQGPAPSGEGQPEGKPIMPARERLIRALEEKNRENPEPSEEAAGQPPPVQGIRTRILPGGISVQQKGAMRTYVPPARQKLMPKIQAAGKIGDEEEGGAQAGAARQMKARPEPPQAAKPGRMASTIGLVPKKLAGKKEAERPEQEPAPEKGQAPLDAPAPEEEGEIPKPPVQKQRELAGEAKLPDEEEGLEAPPPPPPEDEAPKPGEYEQAKEDFKRKMEREDVNENARAESDEFLEQYAKENLVWLYEIYKMGGISHDDFMQKVREKSAESGGSAQQMEAGANPALANIGREIEKKNKK